MYVNWLSDICGCPRVLGYVRLGSDACAQWKNGRRLKEMNGR